MYAPYIPYAILQYKLEYYIIILGKIKGTIYYFSP